MNVAGESDIDIDLGIESALHKEDFTPPSERHLGPSAEVNFKPFRLRIANRPIARDLRELYSLAGKEVPPDIEIFHDNNIWVVTLSMSVVGSGALSTVRELGYRVRYPDKPRVTILEAMPQSRFVKRIAGELKSEACIDLYGKASVPKEITALLHGMESLGFGGGVAISGKANLVGNVSFSVATPVIVATGVGDSVGEWIFTEDGKPLLGDHLMMHILHTPRTIRKLSMSVQLYATVVTSYFFPTRLQSHWFELECPLARAKPRSGDSRE